MSYEWKDPTKEEKFSREWFDEIDRRFSQAWRLFSAAANPFEELMSVETLQGKRGARNWLRDGRPRGDAGWAGAKLTTIHIGGKCVIRHPTNRILQERIGHLLTRSVGRPPNEVRRFHGSFSYQAGSWTKPRRVVAKVEWHPCELYPRVGFIVTNLAAESVFALYNKRGSCEERIKEGKGATNWTRLSLHAAPSPPMRSVSTSRPGL